jgi:glycosyltransferase involved in cell wall biosynthesis
VNGDSGNSMNGRATVHYYVLVCAARNEAELIQRTIASVVAQTVRPLKLIVVSDGSTDGTDDIVALRCAVHPWIELVRLPEHAERDYGGKALAINAGLDRVKDLPYEAIACVDADVSFKPDYFSFLLEKLSSDPALGVVGTPFVDGSGKTYDYRFASIEHVSGCCQMFRRACFESIGGYLPVKTGGIDSIAVITARMRGWKTRTFLEQTYLHHRAMSTAECGPIKAKAKLGAKDFTIGNHPLWELFRCVYQMSRKPLLFGGLALAAGYLGAMMRRVPRPVSAEFIAFHRSEQMHRLGRIFRGNPFSTRNAGNMRRAAGEVR